ncbi:hypothetical protein D3C85_445840 [compost metagenome]
MIGASVDRLAWRTAACRASAQAPRAATPMPSARLHKARPPAQVWASARTAARGVIRQSAGAADAAGGIGMRNTAQPSVRGGTSARMRARPSGVRGRIGRTPPAGMGPLPGDGGRSVTGRAAGSTTSVSSAT